jgi:Tol biopolymer transport system component
MYVRQAVSRFASSATPVWSPSIGPAARVELFVAPAEGAEASKWIRIAPDHEWPDKPRWSPDGRTLFFLSRRPASFFNLRAIRFDPERGRPVGDAMPVTNFDSP